MELTKLDNIRWVIEDAMRFIKREAKRGNKYNGIILDPPAYGHGTDGEKWKLDENILEMLTNCNKVLAPENSFLLLNLYSNGFSAIVADTLTNSIFGNIKEKSFGELVLEDRFGKRLPLSVFSRIKL
jgi:23S rRNA (cytosine1962-C5)-methyltransferase